MRSSVLYARDIISDMHISIIPCATRARSPEGNYLDSRWWSVLFSCPQRAFKLNRYFAEKKIPFDIQSSPVLISRQAKSIYLRERYVRSVRVCAFFLKSVHNRIISRFVRVFPSLTPCNVLTRVSGKFFALHRGYETTLFGSTPNRLKKKYRNKRRCVLCVERDSGSARQVRNVH